METNNPFQTNPVSTDNGKAASIVSYFWFIGWLIAYFAMYKDNKTDLARYQLRQTLLFHLATTVISWGLGILFGILIVSTGGLSIYYLLRIVQVGFLILWIIGLIGAINGAKKPIPFIGERAQTMFPSI
ncbi:hypothetical protein [Pedobacter sp. Leaf176]|uniref:hypothetical protein n=1 Tax=Pedobacter sp. Leaf176 TaxID=1736286 RepID=UPI0006F260EB|nr:hypothetical protein [Pedobacter sp. Leaf176]KQR71447.1 hypothetical protein ASF92_08735 [Pedobacter sp. Leaf176]